MRRRVICFLLVLWFLNALSHVGVGQETTPVTVALLDSQGFPLAGGKVFHLGGPVSPNTPKDFGITGQDGQVQGTLTAGYNYTFYVTYANTTSEKKTVYVETAPVFLTFQTMRIAVELTSSEGTPLAGGRVWYRPGGTWFDFGTTDLDGKVTRELFPGDYFWAVIYNRTRAEKKQDVRIDPIVRFSTTKVTLQFGGTIQYYGNPDTGTVHKFSKPSMEMLPGTIRFIFSGCGPTIIMPLTVAGTEFTGSVVIARLTDASGQGLAGGTAAWSEGSGWETIPGATDAQGILAFVLPGLRGTLAVRMMYSSWQAIIEQYTRYNPCFLFVFTQPSCTPPEIISCPDAVRTSNAPGLCGAYVTWNVTARGDPTPIVTCNFTSGSFFPVGTTTVLCKATNGCAPDASCSFTVTVMDDEAPVIVCPSDKVVSTDPGCCSATLDPGKATAADNCQVVTVAGVRSDGQPLNAPYPKGVTTITWTATDALGNQASCVQIITVVDNEKPELSCPTVNNPYVVTEASSHALLSFTAGASDSCGAVRVQWYIGGTEISFPYAFPLGCTSVRVVALDQSGNSAECTFNVFVVYSFLGLLSPYAPPPRAFKLGSAIPLKWQYTNAYGVLVDSANAQPVVAIYPVTQGAAEPILGAPIIVDTPGRSGLQYDPSTFTWQYNWQTKGLLAGTYFIYIRSCLTGQENGPFPIMLR